jgi:hypothetical protein
MPSCRRAVAANAEIVQPQHRTALGSGVPTRAVTARDPEGILWTFGTYAARTDVAQPGHGFRLPVLVRCEPPDAGSQTLA